MRICLLSLRYLTDGHGISKLYSGIQEAYFRMGARSLGRGR
jgi:hypothetical protein